MTGMSNNRRHTRVRKISNDLDGASFVLWRQFIEAQELVDEDLASLKSVLDGFQWQPIEDTALIDLLLQHFQDLDFDHFFHAIEFADAHAKLTASENRRPIQSAVLRALYAVVLCRDIDNARLAIEQCQDTAYTVSELP